MYDFKVNLYGNMEVTVVADNKEEAQRILNDTIESITVKDIKEKLSPNKDVDINKSFVEIMSKEQKNKDRSVER
ncbi:MAG: hypothetical protein J6K36_01205 [Bacilli bacterium]|nr:hypothetical protein [Bacilli bacterium]